MCHLFLRKGPDRIPPGSANHRGDGFRSTGRDVSSRLFCKIVNTQYVMINLSVQEKHLFSVQITFFLKRSFAESQWTTRKR